MNIPPYSRADQILLGAGMLLNLALVGSGLFTLGQHLTFSLRFAGLMALAFSVGLIVADFVSGILHWAFDTWFDESLTFIRRMVLIGREHHIAPTRIFRYPLHEECGSVSCIACVLTLPIYLYAYFPLAVEGSALNSTRLFWVAASVTFSIFLTLMFRFHRLGHRVSHIRGLVLLQDLNLLMSSRHHGMHHSGRHDTHYCIITCWINYPLDKINFWRGLEILVTRFIGSVPRADDLAYRHRFLRSSPDDGLA